MNEKNYDVIIIGGGLIGLAFAKGLKQVIPQLSMAVIEEKTPVANKRVSAINRASQRFLNDLHVWSLIPKEQSSPYRRMKVWDHCSRGSIEFESNDLAQSELGFIVENEAITSVLRETLGDIDWLCPLRLVSLRETENGVTLHADDDRVFKASLIVGADGAHSWLRTQLNIKQKSWDYHQSAIIATVETQLPHDQTARQCFLPTGPLAFLPLSNPHHSSIVWSTTESDRLCALSDDDFGNELTNVFEHFTGQVKLLDPRRAFPLVMRHADHYVREHVALIGDAIHTIHPLAGQGLNLGFQDARCLIDTLAKAYVKHPDLGRLLTLRSYERARKGENWQMIAAMEGLKRLFTCDVKPINMMRGLGLTVVNRCGPMKRLLIKKAMGI